MRNAVLVANNHYYQFVNEEFSDSGKPLESFERMLQHVTVPTEQFHALLGRLFDASAPEEVLNYMDSMLHEGWSDHDAYQFTIANNGHIPLSHAPFACNMDEFQATAQDVIAAGVSTESAIEPYK